MSNITSFHPPDRNSKTKKFLWQLWLWLVEPSPEIRERDRRRQATLLSALLLVLTLGGAFAEVITTYLKWPDYTGYRYTAIGILILTAIYGISRTRRIRFASYLAIFIVIAITFITGGSQPESVLGGFLDYLFLSLWLGSLYLNLRELILLIVLEIASLLVFPLFVPSVSLNHILVGPFSFIFIASIFLIVITRHRNLLEQDRNMELIEQEKQSRQQAARAEALLRVAARLNAQLDLNALLTTIAEEVARALDVPVSLVGLYDPKQNVFSPTNGVGLPTETIKNMSSFSWTFYEEVTQAFGRVFGLPDLQIFPRLPNLELFKQLNFRSLAFATMEYENDIIGSLTAITRGQIRSFTEEELALLKGLADQSALAIINTRLYKDAHRRLENLQALRTIDIAIASNHDLQKNLGVLLKEITGQLKVDAAIFLLLDEENQKLEYAAGHGFLTPALRFTSLRLGEGIAGRAAQSRQIIHIRDMKMDPQTLAYAPSLAQEGFTSYYAAPLITQGNVKGVLEIFHRSLLEPDEEWLDFLKALAGQAAIAIEATTLFEDLQRTNRELIQAYDATIEGWSRALDLRDKETEGHTQRVTELTLELARAFNFDEKDLTYVRWGGLLHDIGKMGVPDKILLKAGPLDDGEWIVMKQHPVQAYEMLRPIRYLHPALDIPYCHHERWDGTGYPRGLKGEAIPLIARIFAVVDVWDALTSDRPYRAAWTPEQALAHIQQGAGRHFDLHVVEVFTNLITQK
ncbi:MAG TPA: HD domain-containing phosphohydrolase [Anaerolineales bacterium]|nr:HD domain-containing phosphohydrolase [Anaerolineales bacterium]